MYKCVKETDMMFWKFVGMTMALVLSTSANSAIISTDWQSSGDGLLTYDNVSGLEWLDLTETTNNSYNQMLAQINDPGGMYSGFRYATLAELDQLVQQFNLTTENTVTSGFSNDIVNLSGYLGITMFESPDPLGYSGTGFYGYIGDLTWGTNRGSIGMYNSTKCQTGDCYAVQTEYASADLSSEIKGHFLVRDVAVVPVPAAAWLFASGLLGLFSLSRREKA